MTQETDRELLEWAARAAGYSVRCVGDGRLGGNVVFYMEPSQLYWNPLTDDGDALRLAVKLHFYVFCFGQGSVAINDVINNLQIVEIVYDNDWISATRRAIVRAAAEIGKAM